mgnify:CR=1 FL=1
MRKPAITMPEGHWEVMLEALAALLDNETTGAYQRTRALTATRRIHAALRKHDHYATLHPKEE